MRSILVKMPAAVSYTHLIEGFISFIKFFKDDQLEKLKIFDDRGFISSIVYYEDGQEVYQDYLNPNGAWRIREYLKTESSRVVVNPVFSQDFDKLEYEWMPDLILEKLGYYILSLIHILY